MSNPLQSSSSVLNFNGGQSNDSLSTINNKLDLLLFGGNKKGGNKKGGNKKGGNKKGGNKKGGSMKGGMPQRYFKPSNDIGNFTVSSEQMQTFNSKKNELFNNMRGGSDFIPTITSRGPVNYPNSQGTNMSGEDLFRTFSKSGTYIPNDQLNRASVLTDGILGYKLAGGKKH